MPKQQPWTGERASALLSAVWPDSEPTCGVQAVWRRSVHVSWSRGGHRRARHVGGRIGNAYPHPLCKMALQWVQTRVADVTRPPQYGHFRWSAVFEVGRGI